MTGPISPTKKATLSFTSTMKGQNDEREEARKRVSGLSSSKRYNYGLGLRNDLQATRRVLQMCCQRHDPQSYYYCTFARIFAESEGKIANLNRILQNLKRVGEVSFRPECFFVGHNDTEKIWLLEPFWQSLGERPSSKSKCYTVDASNIYRARCNHYINNQTGTQPCRRRSYEAENRATMHQSACNVCGQLVPSHNCRLTIRGQLFHVRCVRCRQCQARLRQAVDYMTFDGEVCCSPRCLQSYNGAHIRQARQVQKC